MRLTLIHPCIGRRPGERYIRTWQMEPLPPATIAGLTPRDVDVRFYDDRMERIPFDEPTDLVAISVETYTAKRAYQIASEYRRRGVPVVMGGFHADALPGRSRRLRRSGRRRRGRGRLAASRSTTTATAGMEHFYRATGAAVAARTCGPTARSSAASATCPIGLVEAGRGCHFKCEFCAVQTVFDATQTRRPIDEILAESRVASASHGEAVLLRRRQHHVEPRRGQGVLPRADPARHPLGQPGEHQRGARRGVPRPAVRGAAARAC